MPAGKYRKQQKDVWEQRAGDSARQDDRAAVGGWTAQIRPVQGGAAVYPVRVQIVLADGTPVRGIFTLAIWWSDMHGGKPSSVLPDSWAVDCGTLISSTTNTLTVHTNATGRALVSYRRAAGNPPPYVVVAVRPVASAPALPADD